MPSAQSANILLATKIDGLIAIEPFLAALSATATVNQMTIASGSLSISLNMQQTSDVTNLLNSFQTSSVFKSSGLTVFNLNPKTGYLIEIDATNK